ncbi:MAG: HD domain-containing protein, partial [Clostridia bacterium]
MLSLAMTLAADAHSGQLRKYSNLPYITHLSNTEAMLSCHPKATIIMSVATWLHDVLEDTKYTVADLVNRRVPLEAIRYVEQLTNVKNSSRNREWRKTKRRLAEKLLLFYFQCWPVGPSKIDTFNKALEIVGITAYRKDDV